MFALDLTRLHPTNMYVVCRTYDEKDDEDKDEGEDEGEGEGGGREVRSAWCSK